MRLLRHSADRAPRQLANGHNAYTELGVVFIFVGLDRKIYLTTVALLPVVIVYTGGDCVVLFSML